MGIVITGIYLSVNIFQQKRLTALT